MSAYYFYKKIRIKPLDKYPIAVYNNTHKRYKGGTNMSEKKCPACEESEKSTHRSEEEKKKLIHRLNRIEGQIRGIRKMLENDAYCTDILMQSAAVNAAVNAFNRELIGRHMHTCVTRDIREGKDEVIDEFVDILQKLMK